MESPVAEEFSDIKYLSAVASATVAAAALSVQKDPRRSGVSGLVCVCL